MPEIADTPPRVNAAISDRPIFTVRFQPLPGRDPIRGLRWALKYALRACRLRALECREEPADQVADQVRRTDAGMSAHTPGLFDNPKPAARGALDGLLCRVDRPCPRCHSLHAVIIDVVVGPHSAMLRCSSCNRFSQWLARDMHASLLKIVATFGRLEEPIRLFENFKPARRAAD